jgi:hypothetical protein
MAPADERVVHQALFGYADGHRLLESSIKLSSRDLYDLSAISDLATGVQLQPDESYLTGTTLQDSPNFAFIRTWAAPEMPRPGCVWSHVLLLPPDILASQRDFAVLSGSFARPARGPLGVYGRALGIANAARPATAHPAMVAQVMATYYVGHPFVGAASAGEALEEAVLAVWSQQWPRLRALFSFRTVRAGAASKGSGTRFDFQPGPKAESAQALAGQREAGEADWIDAAVADATSLEVTPLRRFLWRYGRDLRSPRQRFQNLVKIFLATRDLTEHRLPLTWAQSIAGLFPGAENAATLKRDMLGLEPPPLALCPPVGDEDTLELLAGLASDGTIVSSDSLEARLSNARPAAVPALAASFGNHAPELTELHGTIEGVITRIADDRAVTDTRVPPPVRLAILRQRSDLISGTSLAAVGDDDVLRLFESVEEAGARGVIMDALLRRDAIEYPGNLVRTHASEFFSRAMTARREGYLSYGATALVRGRARDLLSLGVLDSVAGSALAAEAADLLNYPVEGETTDDVQRWLATLQRPGANAEGQSRVNLEAYLFIVAVRSSDPVAWELLRLTVSHVRAVALAGGLINPAYDLLERHLPSNGWNSWDFNKRMLIGLRELRRRTAASRSTVARLELSEDDLDFVADERKSKKKDKGGSLFWPWY